MGIKRARIRGSLWRDYETVCLAVSVGRLAHEGANLVAALEMMESTGKHVVIRLSDTLQRHNLIAYGMDAESAKDISRAIGTAWLNHYHSLLERLSVTPVVIRWDSVLDHVDFQEVHKAFVQASEEQPDFAHALALDVDAFLSRKNFSSEEERALFAKCSRDFLLEEIAGQTILGRQHNYACFYPGKPLHILELARSNTIGLPRGLNNTAFIRFTLETKHSEIDKSQSFFGTQEHNTKFSQSA